MEINGKRETLAKIVTDQRAILDKAESEKRELTTEETASYEAMEKDFIKLDEEIKGEEKRTAEKMERLRKQEEREAMLKESVSKPIKPAVSGGESENRTNPLASKEYREAYREYLKIGKVTPSLEKRALEAGKDASGGYLVVPEAFIADLIKDLADSVFVRPLAKVISMPRAASIGIPELKTKIGDVTWTSELKVGDEDTSMDFSKRTMVPHPLARYIKVSKELLRVAAIDPEAEVRSGLAEKFAKVEENGFILGTGVDQPLGFMVASAAGISTGRDESTGATSTAITADHLWNCVYKLHKQYRQGAIWAFHRDALKMIRKLKTGEGDYIWKTGIADGSPATICGFPYEESEYMPNTFTTTKYVGILGNFKYYWIVDALDMDIQVLTELYAMTNQNAYVGRKATDGAPVLEDAFVRVKLA